MTGKSRAKTKTAQTADLTEREAAAWLSANKDAVNRDLAAARKSLRGGQGREWEFSKFLTKARKRSSPKKK